jgi:XTP/dITP diphosphohydrolase
MDPIANLVLATHNRYKIEEIRQILGPGRIYRILSEYVAVQVHEVGRTLLENSMAKAVFAYKVSSLPALADDSGLFIDALNGEPGIHSARYGSSDEQRIARVLDQLKEKDDRKATFKAVFIFYLGTDDYQSFEGICLGHIAHRPCGKWGFGYDPIFIPEGYTQTFAELGPEVKNQISHRARALKKLKAYLKNR